MKKVRRLSASAKLSTKFHARVWDNCGICEPETLRLAIAACRPEGATGAYAFKWEYLDREFLSKYNGPTTVPAKERADRAIEKLMRADSKCRETGLRLSRDSSKPWFYARAAQIAARLIGDPVDYFACGVGESSTFTSGAAVGYPRRASDPFFKYGSERVPTVTPRASQYGKHLIEITPLWDTDIRIVAGNALFTVPKKFDIDRAAAKEPSLNQALQKGVGKYFRRCLLSVGVDLTDQTNNQKLAREGSLYGNYATIDLSAASDSISPQLVLDILGPRWYRLLDDLRSPVAVLPDGSHHRWNLFSTMGNGFTFELESLLFFAIAKAASEDLIRSSSRSPRVLVYGDDIIVETECAEAVITALEYCGFTTNPDKTFTTGPFRESCGAHYYNGVNVKPIYLRSPIDSPNRVIWLLNALRRWAADDDGVCDPSIYDLWLKLRRKLCPPEFLGGRNIESITEVYSPEAPRQSFKRRIVPREIDGVPALLRWFNYSGRSRFITEDEVIHGGTPLSLAGYSDTYEPLADAGCSMDRICCLGDKVVTNVVTYLPVDEYFDFTWYLFPQETVI